MSEAMDTRDPQEPIRRRIMPGWLNSIAGSGVAFVLASVVLSLPDTDTSGAMARGFGIAGLGMIAGWALGAGILRRRYGV